MKRMRVRVVGLGLALLAGDLRASDPWTSAPPRVNEPIWVPARRESAPLPAVKPTAVPVVIPTLPANWQPPLPADLVRIVVQEPVEPKAIPLNTPRPTETVEPPYPQGDSPQKLDMPRREEDATARPEPRPEPQPEPPAPPRPIVAVQHELPTAPPELMTPHGVGVPGHWGTFGSPPISISRDYPAWRDLFENSGIGRQRLLAPPSGPPATDRVFYSAEYLLWWVNSQTIPVLATTSVNGGDGILGDPGTRVLLGPGAFGDTLRHGFRLRGGAWLNECGTWGIDGSFFMLGRRTASERYDSGTIPTIARPFFAPNINGEFVELVARPRFASGTLTVDALSELWGADVNLRHALCRRCDFRAELFGGYRFLSLRENLTMGEQITALQEITPPNVPGTVTFVQDQFHTKNRFHGGQIGGLLERKWGNVSLEVRGSVALGATIQDVTIDGFQLRALPGAAPERFVGGLLAAGPNIGTFSQSRFSVVPEIGVNLGYWLLPNVKAFVGYNMLYWSNVVRPGDQIDRVVNVSFVPNPPTNTPFSPVNRPQPTLKQSDVWANGIQFGFEFRW